MSYFIPRATPENRKLFRITELSWGCVTVTVLVTDTNTGLEKRVRLTEFSGETFKPVQVDGGWSVEYHASPYLYNNTVKGSRSCSCPLVRLKGAWKTSKDAIFAGVWAKQEEEKISYNLKDFRYVPGTMLSTPVKSWENDSNNARYDA